MDVFIPAVYEIAINKKSSPNAETKRIENIMLKEKGLMRTEPIDNPIAIIQKPRMGKNKIPKRTREAVRRPWGISMR